MQMTKEMAEMMERTMEQYFAAYWQKHATPEQEAKRVKEGKTFKGAFEFAKSIAQKYNGKANSGSGCVAMPDELAYWILMERTAALEYVARRINALLAKMEARLAWRVGDFSVIVPTTRKDFTDEQNRMHNCIGGYFDDCADGRRLCFFVNRKGRRIADVEISTSSGKVLQCYGKHNTETDASTRKYAAAVGKRIASMLRRDKARKAA